MRIELRCEREPTHGVWRARQGLVPEKKVFEVHIEQGHKHGAKVVLRGEAGCSDPNVQPGDVVFVLEQRTHKHFKRIGNDLILEKVRCVHPDFRITTISTCLHQHMKRVSKHLTLKKVRLPEPCTYACYNRCGVCPGAAHAHDSASHMTSFEARAWHMRPSVHVRSIGVSASECGAGALDMSIARCLMNDLCACHKPA